MKPTPSSRPASPDTDEDDDWATTIKLSFRTGGDEAFYAMLKCSIKARAVRQIWR
jgi:hypothetical protein